MTRIDYYFSVLSPFTYLAGDQLERIAARRDATVDYRPIDIMSLFGRTGGVAPKDRHESRRAYRLQDLARIAKLAAVDINLAPAFWPTDPILASCAIIGAQNDGGGDVGALAPKRASGMLVRGKEHCQAAGRGRLPRRGRISCNTCSGG